MVIQEFYKHFLKIRKVCTDSRAIVEGSIFFALKGENFNGNLFALDALEKGCSLAVVDEDTGSKDERIIHVRDVLSFLQEIASHHRSQFNIPVLAITGTNGKTTTKELINEVLSRKYEVVATRGNLNNHIGVPLTLLEIVESTEIAIIEMGANHVGEIADLSRIANPNLGIITNIGYAHLEGFGSPEMIVKAKNELFEYIRKEKGAVFINADDPVLSQLAEGINKITFGENDNADVKGQALEDLFCTVQWSMSTNLEKVHTTVTRLVGAYNFYNILAAICIGRYFQVEEKSINNALESYNPGLNRSQYIETARNRIILDAYNANPDSMKAAISNFRNIESRKKVAILGDMFELGEYSYKAHADVISAATDPDFCKVYLVGEEFAKAGVDKGVMCFADLDLLIEQLDDDVVEDSLVLLKGSRAMKMERLLEVL